MKYFLHLAYKGTHYRGWQRQANVISVQETLEQSITKMVGYPISCIGCGRTDAGVHASQYFCHIILQKELDYDPVFRLNKILPKDIALYDFIPVHSKAQAQFHVLHRTYTYLLHGTPSPFLDELSTYFDLQLLNIEQMQSATTLLVGNHNFRSFCKQPDAHNSTICDVQMATLTYQAQRIRFSITANRFLRGMVRLIVGNLLEVGLGKLSVEEFKVALKSQQPLPYFKMAYPQGLYLSKVHYPYLEVPSIELIS